MPKKHYFAQIPTIAIFIAFAISGPLGLLLFILKPYAYKRSELLFCSDGVPFA